MTRVQNPRWSSEEKRVILCEIEGRNASVPAFKGNTDYDELIASGVVIADYTPPAPVVPQSVTPFQARRALLTAGLLDQVETAVASSNAEVRIAWEYGISVERNSPLTEALGKSLGLSDVQIDQLFIQAAGY